MSKQQADSSKDIYGEINQNFIKVYNSLEKSNPQYLQSFTNLQQECLGAWKNFIESILMLQHQYTTKSGMNVNPSDVTNKAIREVTDEMIKIFDVQNKISFTILDTMRQNVKTLNDNASAFANLTQNIIKVYLSSWATRNQ
jgi:DNA-directed RNA polymerase subunit F